MGPSLRDQAWYGCGIAVDAFAVSSTEPEDSSGCNNLIAVFDACGSDTMADLIEEAMKPAPETSTQIQHADSTVVQHYMEALQKQGLLEPVRAKLHIISAATEN